MKLTYCLAILLAWTAAFTPINSHAHEGDNDAFTGGNGELNPVHVDADGQKAIGLKVEKVKLSNIQNSIKGTGEVQSAETKTFQVTPRVSGVVLNVFAKQGDFVKRGQNLVTIHSTDVAGVLTDLLNAKSQMTSDIKRSKIEYQSLISLQQKEVELALQTLERQQTLFEAKVSAQKDFLTAKNAYEQSILKLDTLKQKGIQENHLREEQLKIRIANGRGQLRIMGMDDASITAALQTGSVRADLAVPSPVSGTVMTRAVTLGEQIAPGKQIFSIVDLSSVWVLINVFQEQLHEVKVGQKVDLVLPSKESLSGKIENIGSLVDPVKKTVSVRIVAANPRNVLKPGMFVSANILLGGKSLPKLAVPNTAIVLHQERPVVFVQEDDHFKPVSVHLGQQFGQLTEVVDGVSVDDPVVIQGATQLKAHSLVGGGAKHHDEGEEDEHGHGADEAAHYDHDKASAESKEHDDHDEHEAGTDKHDEHEAKDEHAEADEHDHHGSSGGEKPEIKTLLTFLGGALSTLLIGAIWFFVLHRFKPKNGETSATSNDAQVTEHVK